MEVLTKFCRLILGMASQVHILVMYFAGDTNISGISYYLSSGNADANIIYKIIVAT